MIPLTSFIVILFCVSPALSAVDVSVPLCFQSGVQWVVTGGTVGGVTYVETTTNENCVFNISNSVSQTLITNYTLCGTSTAISLGGAIHEFIIVVQDVSIYNAATDNRWKIRCEFNTGTSSVESIFVAQSNNPSGNPNNNITRTINPRPVLNLYTTNSQGDETKINSSSVLVLGTNITARITLDQNTTDYSLQVISGEMSSQIIGQISILSTVALLNSTTYCGMYSVFRSFNYKQDVDRVNYAEAEFEAFIPTVTSINLQTTNVQLRLSFRVTLCLVGSGCVQTTCPDHTTRRRRQINDDSSTNTSAEESQNTESATYDLTEGFTVQMNGSPDDGRDINEGIVEVGTNPEVTVCLEKTKFWGLIIGLIVAMILACIASCVHCFFMSKRRRPKSLKKTMSGTSNVTSMTTISSKRKLIGEPVSNKAFILPRFVPVSSSGSSS